jgi:ribosome-associated toxin RatA of RatAB toxin-antitoxin module
MRGTAWVGTQSAVYDRGMSERTPRVPRVGGLSALVGLVLVCLSVSLFLSSARGDASSTAKAPFSSSEQQQLRAGELVSRAAKEERGSLRLMGGNSWQVIDASPAEVFRALLDTTRYSRMLPAVTGSRMVQEQPGYRRVRLEHKKGPLGISYDIGARVYTDRQDITFSLENAPSGLPRAAWGFFSVRPYGASQTLLSYGVMTDPGDGLLLSLVRSVVHEWVLRVPRQVKFFVESREGRKLYADKPVQPAETTQAIAPAPKE